MAALMRRWGHPYDADANLGYQIVDPTASMGENVWNMAQVRAGRRVSVCVCVCVKEQKETNACACVLRKEVLRFLKRMCICKHTRVICLLCV